MGDKLLKRERCTGLLEAKVLVEEYRNHYNQERALCGLGYRTPAKFAASCELASADEDLTKELRSVIALSMAGTENGVRPEQARVAFKIDNSISDFLKPKNGADIQMLSRGALSSPKKKAVRRSLTAKS